MIAVRTLTADDRPAAWRLGRVTFGSAHRPLPPPPSAEEDSAATRWGAFDGTGRLVAKATDLHHEQWWGGRLLPASGIAGVAVEPELRGRGIARSVLQALLAGARERGAVVANLFCTSTAVYHALGFEVGGSLRTVDLPTAVLPRRTNTAGVALRAGSGTDWAAVREVYEAVGRAGNGLLSRHGPLFAAPTGLDLPDGCDGWHSPAARRMHS